MFSCYSFWVLLFVLTLIENHQSWAQPLTKMDQKPLPLSQNLSLISPITDDVIHDAIENDTKKVIRVNPSDLPLKTKQQTSLSTFPSTDSSLYKIQSFHGSTNQRKYMNIKRSQTFNKQEIKTLLQNDSEPLRSISLQPNNDKIFKLKHQPKKKKLHFIYNQKDMAGNLLAKTMPVHVAPGAYPVYYVIAKTNGQFGKYPLKSFNSPQAFLKYLQKSKMENLPVLENVQESP